MEEKQPSIVVSMEMGGEIVKRNLSEDLKLDEEHINEYLIRQPGIVAYWNNLHERQKSVVDRVKVAKQRKYAELQRHYRDIAKNDESRVTNAEIESRIFADTAFQEIEDRLLEEEEKCGVLKSAVEALREMRSTLISLSANMRAGGDIKIKTPEERYLEKRRKV